MAQYDTIAKSVEAYELGTTPTESWFDDAIASGSIVFDNPGWRIGCPFGWADAQAGDFVVWDSTAKTYELVPRDLFLGEYELHVGP